MTFQTDSTWTPSTYRKARDLWAANCNETDAQLAPEDAKPTASPRHASIASKLLRPLRTWRSATSPEQPVSTAWLRYDLKPDNDNFEEDDEPVPMLLDTVSEIWPSEKEMHREWAKKDRETGKPLVEYRDAPVARLSKLDDSEPKAAPIRVAVGGDVEFGVQRALPDYAAPEDEEPAPKRDRRIVTRIGRMTFSNGEQQEPGHVLRMGKAVKANITMPAGALIGFRGRRPTDKFRAAKGSLPETVATVGIGGRNPGVGLCPDPLADAEWSLTIRDGVGEATAAILDCAMTAANFTEIGEMLGKHGKNAERAGKKALIAACDRLERFIADNDNSEKAMAA
ncbi:MAG: hypothetical protein WBA44_05105 [Mesorhizobium sp.]